MREKSPNHHLPCNLFVEVRLTLAELCDESHESSIMYITSITVAIV